MTSIATLERLPAAAVAKLLLAEQEAATNPTIAVVDVRDDDHIGGHIRGSINAPSRTLDARMPTLVRQLADKRTVIFHCALSQQRGPGAALRYLRERERMFPPSRRRKNAASRKEERDNGVEEKEKEKEKASEDKEEEHDEQQKVYVLDRGFVGWQEVYAEDERLTEGYRKELWEDGYWG